MSRYVGVLSPRHGRHLLRIFARFAGWSYDEHHLIDVCRPRLRLLRPEVFVIDLSFDSNKHDQTRQDATKGAESLKTAADGIDTFADAQVESVWGEEAGVDAARRALQESYFTLRDGFNGEQEHVLNFGTKVDETEKSFRQMEEQNADYFSQAAAAMSQDPAVATAAAGSGVGTGGGSSASAEASNTWSASLQGEDEPSAVSEQPEI